jgi:hypothetical protein
VRYFFFCISSGVNGYNIQIYDYSIHGFTISTTSRLQRFAMISLLGSINVYMSINPVDRVLRQQKADQEAQAAQEQQLISDNNAKHSQQGLAISANAAEDGDSRSRAGGSILSNWRQKFKPSSPPSRPLPPSNLQPLPPPPTELGPPPPPPPRPNTNGSPKTKDPMRPYSKGPQWNSDQEVTPHANIERNVRAAIEVHSASFRVGTG